MIQTRIRIGLGIAVALSLVLGVWCLPQWRNDPSLSHAPLLALIFLGLLWYKRSELRLGEPLDRIGPGVLCLFAVLELVGGWAEVAFLTPLAFLGMAIGATWTLGGRHLARALVGPLGLLTFTIPWPTTLVSTLAFPMQLISSAYAAMFAGTLGLVIHREGVHISVLSESGSKPIYSMLVAQQCSGLTSLGVLLSFGYLMAYFTPVRWWGRVAMVAAMIPMALLANAIRLTIILLVGGLASPYWAGWVHDREQPVLIFFCGLGLLGLRQLLLRWKVAQAPEGEPTNPPDTRVAMSPKRLIVVNAVLAATLVGLFWASRTSPAEGSRGDYLHGLNLPFKDWMTREQELTPRERELLLPDTVLLRQYHSRNTQEEVGIAVIAGHRKQTVHTPAFCMAGGGWNTISESEVRLSLGPDRIEATRAVMEAGNQRILVTYFFTDGALHLRSLPAFQFQQFLQRLRGRATSGALVRILVPIESDQVQAERLSEQFARAVLPELLHTMHEARRANR